MSKNWIHKRSWKTRLLHAFLLAGVLLAVAYFSPSPYQLEAPGPVYAASNLVQLEGLKSHNETGQLLLPTVVSQPATWLMTVYALTHPSAHLSPRAQSGPVDEGEAQMGWSQLLAIENAFQFAASEDKTLKLGLRIVSIDPESPNREVLRPGDILTGIEGEPLSRAWQLTYRLNTRAQNKVRLELLREDRRLQPQAKVWEKAERRILGVKLEPVAMRNRKPMRVQFNSHDVSGASGGLVFALEILRQLSPTPWLHGRRIAVTGTLDRGGEVGPIQGVIYKRVAAQQAGAELLICPLENLEECQTPGLPVVGVHHLREAVAYLRRESRPPEAQSRPPVPEASL